MMNRSVTQRNILLKSMSKVSPAKSLSDMSSKDHEWETCIMKYHQLGGLEVMSDDMKQTYIRNMLPIDKDGNSEHIEFMQHDGPDQTLQSRIETRVATLHEAKLWEQHGHVQHGAASATTPIPTPTPAVRNR